VTDGRTDGPAMAYTRYSIYAVARKNPTRMVYTDQFSTDPKSVNFVIQAHSQKCGLEGLRGWGLGRSPEKFLYFLLRNGAF